jgi:hypothetical protein
MMAAVGYFTYNSGLGGKNMKRGWRVMAGLPLVGLLLVPMAKAGTIFDFSVNLTGGNAPGIVTGMISLPFSSGSGAATSVVLTSFPAAFGSLVGGNTVTSWLDQVENSFTVVSGMITAYDFGADTGPTLSGTDYFSINNTAVSATDGAWFFPADYNSLQAQGGNVFGQITSATAVTFTPEPASFVLLGIGLAGLIAQRKSTKRS